MDVRLVAIHAASDQPGEGLVRIELDLDGCRIEGEIQVVASVIPGLGADMLVPSEELNDLFRHELQTLHRVCRLVSEELAGRPVPLPQRVAA